MKPVGSHPFRHGDVTILRSWEMLEGLQALWYQGRLLGVFRIGEPIPGIICDTITLHPLDYEAVKKSVMEQALRDRARDSRSGKVRLPLNYERIIRRRMHGD